MGDPTRTPVTPLHVDDWMPRAAALTICARAKDETDARLLLTACGLIPDNGAA